MAKLKTPLLAVVATLLLALSLAVPVMAHGPSRCLLPRATAR